MRPSTCYFHLVARVKSRRPPALGSSIRRNSGCFVQLFLSNVDFRLIGGVLDSMCVSNSVVRSQNRNETSDIGGMLDNLSHTARGPKRDTVFSEAR